jgi:flagellar L-ring protein precursor FlgH
VLVAFAATGCIEHALLEAISETEYPLPAARELPPPTDGAIWRGETRSGSFLQYDRKARGLGDLVTVEIFENLSAGGSANTTLDGSSALSADLTSDVGFTAALEAGMKWFFSLLGVTGGGNTPAGQTVNVVDSNRSSEFSGDGETNRESRFRGTVTCQIVDVHPGGVFEIYGRREILVNHELQLVTIAGLVRRHDIGLDNRVVSGQLANAKLTFDGIGVIDDKQRPSLLSRAMDWLYPF